MSVPRPRIGVWRPEGAHPVVAVAEARVVRVELERRLGPLTLDLRVRGEVPLGPWAPLAHAAWPAEIDALLDPSELLDEGRPPLTSLFARSVDPRAAAVRRRMLVHLGLIDGARFDDDVVSGLGTMSVTPTDVWLMATAAPSVAVSDRAIAAFATATDADRAQLDEAFDAVATRLRAHDVVARAADQELARTRAELEELRTRYDGLVAELARERSEVDSIVDRLGDRLATQQLAADP